MLMFFDLETSDLLHRDKPLDDPIQPWAVSIAAELCHDNGDTADFFHVHIRADERSVRAGAEAVHGVSSRQAAKTGVSEIAALGLLCGFAGQAKCAVAYAASFDRDLVTSLLLRRGKDTTMWTRPGLAFIDPMPAAAQFCKIVPDPPRPDGSFKWPSLDDACEMILGEPRRKNYHNAWDDCQRVRRLYFHLCKRGVIEGVA